MMDQRRPATKEPQQPTDAGWVEHARLLWQHRRLLIRIAALSLIAGIVISLVLPKRYVSMARIMPPEQQGSTGLMMAALASKAGLGSLGSLAPVFFTGHSTTALFVDLLRSGSVSDQLIDQFNLQHIYGKRYRMDAAKRLARNTSIHDDKRSGVITIQVEDSDPTRARDIAQGYLSALNKLIVETNTSAAHRERVFVEKRLVDVQQNLSQAQRDLRDFSARNGTIDLKEQTRGMVDAGARVEAQLLLEEASLNSLRQVYGDRNIRVREAEARVAALRSDLIRMAGESRAEETKRDDPMLALAPALRQVPALAVPYADLYRHVKVQETLFELLTQQYETSRIEEAKDTPVLSIIDVPGIPEKKSFPPRTLITLAFVLGATTCGAVWVLLRKRWSELPDGDPQRVLLSDVVAAFRGTSRGAA